MVPDRIYSFTHLARPRVKERPRAGLHGRKLYTPKSTLDAQAELAASYKGPLYEGPIEIGMNFCPDHTFVQLFPWTDPSGAEYVSPLRGDTDNYSKLVLDALEGVAYANDRQVMAISAAKLA